METWWKTAADVILMVMIETNRKDDVFGRLLSFTVVYGSRKVVVCFVNCKNFPLVFRTIATTVLNCLLTGIIIALIFKPFVASCAKLTSYYIEMYKRLQYSR
jgi:hypothetical protein